MERYYRVDAVTFEWVFRYLRRRPHEEVDGLLRAIAVGVVGPVSARRGNHRKLKGRSVNAVAGSGTSTRQRGGKLLQ